MFQFRALLICCISLVMFRVPAAAQDTQPATQPGTSGVSNLEGSFRNGQTFLTWKEIPGKGVKYRVYRSLQPIQKAEQLTSDTLLGTVKDYTSFNWMASIDLRDVGLASQKKQVYEIPERVYFVIEEGQAPLSDDTGLFVYTAKDAESAYYAVTTLSEGVEDKGLTLGNSLADAIEEQVEPVKPVKQNERDYVHWTDNVGTENYPAMSSLPSVPYIYRVMMPKGAGPFAAVANLHGSTVQYNSPEKRRKERNQPPLDVTNVTVFLDSPNLGGTPPIKDFDPYPLVPGGWYGYNSSWGTGRPESEGELADYHARRVLWTLKWAQKTFSTDPDRMALEGASMGGIGSLLIAMKYPDRFSAIRSIVPPLGFSRSMREAYLRGAATRSTTGSTTAAGTASGPATRRLFSSRGGSRSGSGNSLLSMMMPIRPFEFLEEHPEVELPYITMVAGRTDTLVGFEDKKEFAKVAQEKKLGYQLIWHPGGHGGGQAAEDLPTTRTITAPDLGTFRIHQSFPAIANSTANDDPGTVNLAVPPERRAKWDAPGVGDLVGSINGQITWIRDSIIDEVDRYEITLELEDWAKTDKATADVTPRRTQAFKLKAGDKVAYKALDATTDGELASGTVEADQYGRATVKGVPITVVGTRLILEKGK